MDDDVNDAIAERIEPAEVIVDRQRQDSQAVVRGRGSWRWIQRAGALAAAHERPELPDGRIVDDRAGVIEDKRSSAAG